MSTLFDAIGTHDDPGFRRADLTYLPLDDTEGMNDVTFTFGAAMPVHRAAASSVETAVAGPMAPILDQCLDSFRDEFDADADGRITYAEVLASDRFRQELAPDLFVDAGSAISYGFTITAVRE